MKLKDSYNVVVYGDSISKGIVYDNEKYKYTTLKESFANIVSDSIKGTVYNAGRFGSTIIRGVSKMYNDVLKKIPDIVIIEFGGNDCDYDWDDIAHHPDTEHRPNTDLKTFRETLLNMISTFNSSNITPVLMTLPPLDSKKYFQWVSKGDADAEKNILGWLGSMDKIFSWHKCYNDIILDVAAETKTVLVDVRSEFLKYPDYSELLCSDGIHPNSAGHSLIASVFLDFLKKNYNFILQ
jgi:Lysophospholipase L1 and related esterases